MDDWFSPDERWRLFGGVRTRKEYIKEFVLDAHFHSDVPKRVVESYRTAQYLMAHAYYHWPMYDEAYKKLLGIFELSIKQKAKRLNISTEKGDGKPKDLSQLINQLFKPSKAPEINKWADRVRQLRNHFAHPDDHSYVGGVIALGASQDLINLVNLVFHKQDIIGLIKQQTDLKSRQVIRLCERECLAIRESNTSENHFIYDLKVVESIVLDGKEHILIAYKLVPKSMLNGPLGYTFMSLRKFEITKDQLECNRHDGTKFLIEFAVKPFEMMISKEVKKGLERLNEETKRKIEVVDHYAIPKALSKHRYLYYWSANRS